VELAIAFLMNLYSMTFTGGGVQVPLRTCSAGKYIHKIRKKPSAGKGSKLDSLSAPELILYIDIK
jgi:hypothetical protein